MRSAEYTRRSDVLAMESTLDELPRHKEYVLKEIGRGKRVLDLGCVGGQFSKLIKDQNNEVYGVDLNERAARLAEKRGIRVKIFDLNDGIPFEDQFFEAIYAGDLIERIYDTKFLFEECNRVLKPNGILVFTALNLNSLSNRLRILTGDYLEKMGAFPEDHFGEHIRVFNVGKIQELCRHTGFKVKDITGMPLHKLISPIVRLVPQLGELLVVKAQRLDD